MDWGLSDVILAKGKFTRNNMRLGPGHIAARLDRFLIQDTFLLLGVNTSSKILAFEGSDHKHVMLEMRKDMNLGPIPFRFFPLWVSHNDFKKTMDEAWITPVTGSPFFIWEPRIPSNCHGNLPDHRGRSRKICEIASRVPCSLQARS